MTTTTRTLPGLDPLVTAWSAAAGTDGPLVLALGEPLHAVEGFREARNAALPGLVTHHGFRSVALETDAVAALRADAYVAGGGTTLDDAAAALSHGFGDRLANRALLTWLREHNAGRTASEQVRFHGIDGPLELVGASPRGFLLALLEFLTAHVGDVLHTAAHVEELCGEDGTWDDRETIFDATRSVGNGPAARELRGIADDLADLLHRAGPQPAGTAEARTAHLHARTATGLMRYHAAMATPGPQRVNRLMGIRDGIMAAHLEALAATEAPRGPTLVFAHNQHLQRAVSEWALGDEPLTWWSAGAIAARRLGPRYRFVAGDLAAAPALGLPAAPPGTYQAALQEAARAGGDVVIGGSDLPAPLPPRTDVTPQQGYFPLDPSDRPAPDAVLFLPTEVTP